MGTRQDIVKTHLCVHYPRPSMLYCRIVQSQLLYAYTKASKTQEAHLLRRSRSSLGTTNTRKEESRTKALLLEQDRDEWESN